MTYYCYEVGDLYVIASRTCQRAMLTAEMRFCGFCYLWHGVQADGSFATETCERETVHAICLSEPGTLL